MFTNEANKQLQCIPTPDIYVSRGGNRFMFERNNVRLALLGFEAFFGYTISPAAENNYAAISLRSMMVNGKQPLAASDSGNARMSLVSLAAIVADSFTAPTENNLVAISLRSMVAITAQIAAAQTDNAGAAMSLRSMIV